MLLKAERMYKRALKADPGHMPSLVNYAVLLQEARGDVDSAEELYLRALVEVEQVGIKVDQAQAEANEGGDDGEQ